MSLEEQFAPFAAKMRAEGLAPLVVDTFRRSYELLSAGETGFIPGSVAQPVTGLPAYDEIEPELAAHFGQQALARTVVCKLNGGLGTGMGLEGPKSLLPVKNGLTFLDITARQVLWLRRQAQARLPLVLMNSFSTREPSLEALARYPELEQDLTFDFVQNKVPKVAAADLTPAVWPDDPSKEWCPPGHGDIYPSLVTSGLLARMLELGYEYVFVSNSDNLGAVLDTRILGWFAAAGVPFLMEVAQRTPADSKGGHLARRPDGQLILRELAQCPPDEVDDFQDIGRYGYFNTNNLWIHLPSLQAALAHRHGVLELPLIRNEKPVDPTRPESPRVYQLETAMGSAISIFAGSQAICVPRSRFAPVKKNGDLLALWSDAYVLTPEYHLVLAAGRETAPVVKLDERYYGLLALLQERFPYGAPSLVACRSLSVEGDVRFGHGVVARGDVQLRAEPGQERLILDGTVLEG